MNKVTYNPKEVRSLKEIQYQKARIVIELAYLQDQIRKETDSYLHGSMMKAMNMGWGVLASGGKWFIGMEILLKGWKLVRAMWKKKKEKKNS